MMPQSIVVELNFEKDFDLLNRIIRIMRETLNPFQKNKGQYGF